VYNLSVGCHGASTERLTTHVVVSMVFSSDAGSTPAISTMNALMVHYESVSFG
jgi:hypothetical protein